jgi:hypothetical protein
MPSATPRVIQGEHKVFPCLQTFTTKKITWNTNFFKNVTQLKKCFYNTLVHFNMCAFCIPRSIFVINFVIREDFVLILYLEIVHFFQIVYSCPPHYSHTKQLLFLEKNIHLVLHFLQKNNSLYFGAETEFLNNFYVIFML